MERDVKRVKYRFSLAVVMIMAALPVSCKPVTPTTVVPPTHTELPTTLPPTATPMPPTPTQTSAPATKTTLPSDTSVPEDKIETSTGGLISPDNTAQIEILHILQGHGSQIVDFAFSPGDGQIVSLGGDLSLKRWDAISGEETHSLKLQGGPVYNGAISPIGDLFAVEGPNHQIQLRHTQDGQIVREMAGHTSFVMSFSFSPDGRLLATGDSDGAIRVWETETGQLIHALAGHPSPVGALAFSPGDSFLASGGVEGSHDIKIWDLTSGNEVASLEKHNDNVYGLAFSPDGTTLASASGDRTVKLWDVESGGELQTFRGHRGRVYSADFSPDGKLLTSSDFDRNIKLWDVASGRELNNLKGHTDLVEPVKFSPNGCWLASGSFDATIILWGIPGGICLTEPEAESSHTNTWIRTFEGPNYGAFFDIVLTPDRNLLAVGTTNHLHFPPYSGDALFMKLTLDGDVLWEQTWGGDGYEQAWAVTLAEDGGYYIFGETDSYGAGDRDFFLLKVNENGFEEWFQTYGKAHREWPYGMLRLANGDLLIYGFTESLIGKERNQYALRIKLNGDVIWEYIVESPVEEIVIDAVETEEGNLVLAVIIEEDGKLVKLDADGTVQWEKRYELAGWQYASQIAETDDGGVILAGFSMSSGSRRQADIWLARCTPTGELEWETSFGDSTRDDYATSLIRLKDGTHLMGGIANGILLNRINKDGDVLWRRSLVGQSVYGSEALIELENGGYLVAGFIQISNGRSYDAILLRTNAEGQVEE